MLNLDYLPKNSIIYENNEEFHIRQSRVVLKSKDDQVTETGTTVTLYEDLATADMLKKEKIRFACWTPSLSSPWAGNSFSTVPRLPRAGPQGGGPLLQRWHHEVMVSAVVGKIGVTMTCLTASPLPRSRKPTVLLKMFGTNRDDTA